MLIDNKYKKRPRDFLDVVLAKYTRGTVRMVFYIVAHVRYEDGFTKLMMKTTDPFVLDMTKIGWAGMTRQICRDFHCWKRVGNERRFSVTLDSVRID